MYLSIASYRDPMLQSTIDSAFKNADNPEKLKVGCFISAYLKDEKHLILNDYDKKVSFEVEEPGKIFSITRARNKSIQWLKEQYEYVIQVDSHTRFLKSWDTQLINCYEDLESDKAILSGYIPGWIPKENGNEFYHKFNGIEWFPFLTYNIGKSKNCFFDTYEIVPDQFLRHNPGKKTIMNWHMAGMFIFSTYEYFSTILQPEWICFWGEELYNSLVAFTNGWDVYYPEIMPLRQMYPQDLSKEENIKYFDNPIGPNKNWRDFPSWTIEEKASTDRIIDAILQRKTGLGYLGTSRDLDKLYELLGYDIGKLLESWRNEYKQIH